MYHVVANFGKTITSPINLLEKCYTKTKEKVDAELKRISNLNSRLMNPRTSGMNMSSISVSTPDFSLFLMSEDITDTLMDSRAVSTLVLDKVEAYFGESIWDGVSTRSN